MARLQYIISPYCQPAMTAVLSYLRLEDVLQLARTCRAFRRLPKELLVGKYNINPELRGWFTNPRDFRSIQAQYGAVIVEVFARNFFSRTTSELDCLDVYLPREHRKVFTAYLRKEGYRDHDADDDRVWFQKVDARGNAWTIILDLDKETVVVNLFKWAMTTACMHLITWNKAYAIFPYTTFVRKECYMVRDLSDAVADYCTDIEGEKIRVKSISWRQKGLSGNCDTLTRRRRIGDKYTWIINLDTNGVLPSTVPDKVLECAAFNLAPTNSEFSLDGGPAMRYEIRYDVWKHGALRYEYTTLKRCEYRAEHDMGCIRKYCRSLAELSRRLDEECLTNAMKSPVQNQPKALRRFQTGRISSEELVRRLAKLGLLEYYDEEVMECLRELFDEQCKADANADSHWGSGGSRKRKWEA